jgi:Ca-activated chloride channel family protein
MILSVQKSSKQYLKQKVSRAALLLWVVLGFVIGSSVGHFIFRADKGDHVKFTMVYSSEKASWIGEIQPLFLEYWAQKMRDNSSLKPISLDFQPYGSGDSLIALLNGEIKPAIWSPASNIWIPLLNSKWMSLNEDNKPLVANYSRYIYSPVVIATWENFLTQYPFSGFQQLHSIITANPGLVKMAHCDPRESNSGFMATVMMVSSKLHMDPADITLADIASDDVIRYMREIESAAIFYGKSTGFLGKYMRDQGPDALKVAILYENLIVDYCKGAEQKFGQKIKAVYPEEGALFSDHPLCILNAEWVSAEQEYVAMEFLNFLSQPDIIRRAIQSGFRPIDNTLLNNPEIQQTLLDSFNEENGVISNQSMILELHAPTDGNVIARIPDLWLLTRNRNTMEVS